MQATVNEALEADATRAVVELFAEVGREPGRVAPGTSTDDPVNQSTLDGTFEGLPRVLVLQQAMGDLVAQEGAAGLPGWIARRPPTLPPTAS